jgi:hypothetical protein
MLFLSTLLLSDKKLTYQVSVLKNQKAPLQHNIRTKPFKSAMQNIVSSIDLISFKKGFPYFSVNNCCQPAKDNK